MYLDRNISLRHSIVLIFVVSEIDIATFTETNTYYGRLNLFYCWYSFIGSNKLQTYK